ncbi:MAG: hypothetical protein ABJB86_00595 [Bacteroidota bacterium]
MGNHYKLIGTIVLSFFLIPATGIEKDRSNNQPAGIRLQAYRNGNRTISEHVNQIKPTCIYLTIDDGPSDASFFLSNIAMADSALFNLFVIGDSVRKNESRKMFFQLYQLNHFIEIGNHSFSHANKHYHDYYMHPTAVVNDFLLNEYTLGLQNKIARLPGRNTWRIDGRERTDLGDDSTAANLLLLRGYRIFGWDVEWHWPTDSSHSIKTAHEMIQQIEHIVLKKNSFAPGHIVVLCHESMFIDSASRVQLELFIDGIRQKEGYRLEHLSNYP